MTAKKDTKAKASAKTKKEVETETENKDQVSDALKDTKGTKKVAVLGNKGRLIRVYSEEMHGKAFLELAKEFTKKNEAKGYYLGK